MHLAVNASHLTAIMLAPCEGPEALEQILADERKNAVVLGPGLGVGETTRDMVAAALRSKAAAVLDADAFTSFAPDWKELSHLTSARAGGTRVVLTPHEGEFERLFPGRLKKEGRLGAARSAAHDTRTVIVLKGPDTVVAAPPPADAKTRPARPPSMKMRRPGSQQRGLGMSLPGSSVG